MLNNTVYSKLNFLVYNIYQGAMPINLNRTSHLLGLTMIHAE